jgi:uncharacterized YigZ family protein
MSSKDEGYLIPAGPHEAEIEIDRSRFIATIGRAKDAVAAHSFVQWIRTRYPDATHHCWAFVAGAPGDSGAAGQSDDGEPHGTAGRPMLTVLLHCGIGEIVAVVTRYYGGTKLGTGGLVKAYGGAVQHALESLAREMKVEYDRMELQIDYSTVTVAQQLFATFAVLVRSESYTTAVNYLLDVPHNHVEPLRAALADATSGAAVWSHVPEERDV